MFGWFGKKKAVGTIAKVDFSGSGANAGQLLIRLDSAKDFYVFMDTPRQRIFEIFNLACSAMWDAKGVEIIHARRGGLDVLSDIRVI